MAYNLSRTQKEVMRSLVPLPTTSLAIVWTFGGAKIKGLDTSESRLLDSVTIPMLRSLDRLGLISLREGPQPNYCEVEVLQDAIDLVLDDFRETAVSSEPPVEAIGASQESRILLKAMDRRFSEGEIRSMILGWVDYENLPGQTKVEKTRGLIDLAQRSDKLLYLLSLVISESPETNWAENFSRRQD